MIFDSEKFCIILAKKQLSIREVAKKTNIHESNISKYKTGSQKPNPKTIGKLAEVLEVDAIDLIK